MATSQQNTFCFDLQDARSMQGSDEEAQVMKGWEWSWTTAVLWFIGLTWFMKTTKTSEKFQASQKTKKKTGKGKLSQWKFGCFFFGFGSKVSQDTGVGILSCSSPAMSVQEVAAQAANAVSNTIRSQKLST